MSHRSRLAGSAVLWLVLASCRHPSPKPTERTTSSVPRDAAAPPPTLAAAAPPAAPPPPADDAATMGTSTELLAEPVRASRIWSTALAPNTRGGWNFIAQSYELGSSAPTEFVVLDLATGKTTITEGEPKIYANQHFQANKKELRAPNGRIFFLELDNHIAYYDPMTETVQQLGKVIDPSGPNKYIYQGVFGPDGKLYGGTQSSGLPTTFQLDPTTLKSRVIGTVGRDRKGYSYAYDMAVDPPWVYVAVGELPWELAAINIDTGESRILATRSDNAFIKVAPARDGIIAELATGLRTPAVKKERLWCADGKIFPFTPRYDRARLPFKPRDVTPVSSPLQDPPDLDLTDVNPDASGIGRVRWRPHGSAGPFREVQFQVKNTEPVPIESLVALPDGTLLGNARSYHGFFRYNPADGSTKFYGAHGPSQGPRVVVNGHVYISGYPNGVLFEYDPKRPWTAPAQLSARHVVDPTQNPRELGYFSDAGAHYAYFLEPSRNGRLYYAGRRERDGFGSGVGFYELATGRFGGHHKNLDDIDPRGLVVLDRLKRVVFSGGLRKGPAQSGRDTQLVIYDYDLDEVARETVKPGLTSTGKLFPTADPDVIVGIVPEERAAYRYDVAKGKLLAWQDLGGVPGVSTQRASDHSIWVLVGRKLERLDPATLEAVPATRTADLPAKTSLLVWQGDSLYLTVGAELRRVKPSELVGGP